MALPKVKTPKFKITLPSNKQEIWFRPFQVKEEKMLLIAKQSDEADHQIQTVKQILQNCILEPEDFNVDDMASFDIEYLFLKLRAKSVGEVVNLKIIPQKRNGLPPMDTEINIDELEPTFDENHTNIIDLDDNMKVKMKYPTFGMLTRLSNLKDYEMMFDLFADSMETIYDGDSSYDCRDYSKEEMMEFLEQLQSNQLLKIKEFFDTMPRIQKDIVYEWTNPEDEKDTHKETITLQGIMSFLS